MSRSSAGICSALASASIVGSVVLWLLWCVSRPLAGSTIPMQGVSERTPDAQVARLARPSREPRQVASRAASDAAARNPGHLASVAAKVTTPDHAPIARAQLVLRRGARIVGRRRVACDGTARFDGLVPGSYSLAIEADSLPPGYLARIDAASGSERVLFSLQPGRKRDVALPAVTGAALHGRVLDAAGAPIAGAELRLQAIGPELILPSRATRSDEGGFFELRDVLPGSYRLQTRWPAGHHAGAPPAPGVHRLDSGFATQANVRAIADPRSLAGVLVDEAQRPLAGRLVQCDLAPDAAGAAHELTRTPRTVPWSRVLARTRTDEQGRYRFEGLPPSEVLLSASLDATSGQGGLRSRLALAERIHVGRVDLTGSLDIELSAMTLPTSKPLGTRYFTTPSSVLSPDTRAPNELRARGAQE